MNESEKKNNKYLVDIIIAKYYNKSRQNRNVL